MKKLIILIAMCIIILPAGQGFAQIGPDKGSNIELEQKAITHTVAVGDTLWAIANKYDVSIEELISLNNLDSSIIHPGQQLKMNNRLTRVENVHSQKYVVKKGDTLIEIARNHNISLEELIQSNAISSYIIYPGSELIVRSSNISKPFSPEAAITTINDAGIHTPVPSPDVDNAAKSKTEVDTSVPVAQPSATNSKNTATETPTSSGREMTMTATAYTAYCTGCSGTTYTGINLRANPKQKVIAVDPNVIPLGSKVWVEGYGEAIAGDIGGAIKGNIIDVFIEHQQDALNWGRRTVQIKILD